MESSFTLLRVVRAAKKRGFGYGLVGLQPTDFDPWEGRGLLRDRHQPEPVPGLRESAGPWAGVPRWMTPPLILAIDGDARNAQSHLWATIRNED